MDAEDVAFTQFIKAFSEKRVSEKRVYKLNISGGNTLIFLVETRVPEKVYLS